MQTDDMGAAGLVGMLADAALRIDSAMMIQAANAAAGRLLGMHPDELVDRRASEILGSAVCEGVIAPCLAAGSVVARGGVQVPRGDGAVGELLAYGLPLAGPDGGGREATVVLHDPVNRGNLEKTIAEQQALVSEYHDSTMELAIGISELFEVLSEVRRGNLEARVSQETVQGPNELVTEMASAVNATVSEIQEQLDLIRRQQFAIQELSTPVLQIWDHVLALPVIGVVDTRRAAMIMERLLSEISTRQAHFVILDITGVEVVDTRTADQFIKVIKAAELLGSKCMLTGIRPAVAQTLVEIGVDLSSIVTLRDMQDALRECLVRMGDRGGSGRSAATLGQP